MVPKTKNLFISYRSIDGPKVDKIARDLAMLRHADDTPLYTTWQDKHNIPPGSPHWWDAVVNALIACDMFVFFMSEASLQSPVCIAELDYAYKRNRPIIPVVLEGEFFPDPNAGYKSNIGYWHLVPEWLKNVQFLFYTGAEFFKKFEEAVAEFEKAWPRDIIVARPPEPGGTGTPHDLYESACDYAYRLAFAEAEKHFRGFVRRNDQYYAGYAGEWLELLGAYAELIEISEKKHAPRMVFEAKWQSYTSSFPKDCLEGVFDPKNLGSRITPIEPATPPASTSIAKPSVTPTPAPTSDPTPALSSPVNPAPKSASVQTDSLKPRLARLPTIELMPDPFAWIDIHGMDYSIAKYPITTSQYALFINAGGYVTRKWWSAVGWRAVVDQKWSEPRYWDDSLRNGLDHPVVGVSWFEAIAYCVWLREVTGERITLPTQDQWRYAAQGDDGRNYPWGATWDGKRCNSNVDKKGTSTTTPVQHYEGRGDSPFGVVDMAGNVLEWSQSPFDKKDKNIAEYVLHGGSWNSLRAVDFRCNARRPSTPYYSSNFVGFRIVSLGPLLPLLL